MGLDRRMYSHGDQCQIFREPAQSCKKFLRPKRFCEHNTRICQISFFCEVLTSSSLGSEHFYNDSKRFREFCVEVTMNCHSTNSDKKPCPKTLLQGFFVNKSSLNKLMSRNSKNLIRWICIEFGGTDIKNYKS